jgi:hypothetical protein
MSHTRPQLESESTAPEQMLLCEMQGFQQVDADGMVQPRRSILNLLPGFQYN